MTSDRCLRDRYHFKSDSHPTVASFPCPGQPCVWSPISHHDRTDFPPIATSWPPRSLPQRQHGNRSTEKTTAHLSANCTSSQQRHNYINTMVLTPPPPPTRFPCWVRAVYSWGGEVKKAPISPISPASHGKHCRLILTISGTTVKTRSWFHRRRFDRMLERRRRLLVGGQVMARQESCWLLSIQFR